MRGKLLASWASAAILMASSLLVMLSEPTNAQLVKSSTQTEGQVRQWKTARTPRASVCPWSGTEIYRQAETKNFKVYICSEEGNRNSPKYYLGIAKDNGNRIALPISDYDPETEIYAARNGSYTYVLRMRVGDLIIITPSGKRYIENLFEVGD